MLENITLRRVGTFIALLGILATTATLLFKDHIDAYAIKITERTWGAKPSNPEQEAFVKNIAKEMGIDEPLIIRKMNHTALATFGYHNAFVCRPAIFDIITISSQAFVFISDGFFEDISLEEQRFLIGHELIHAREGDMMYAELIKTICTFLGILFIAFSFQKIADFVKRFFGAYHLTIFPIAIMMMTFLCFIIPNLITLAYRRHIERRADRESIRILKTYDGCLATLNCWETTYKMPSDNPYYGLFSSHPSCTERKQLCLDLKKQQEIL